MTNLRVALEWFLNPDHLPFLIAQEKGWFAEAGLNKFKTGLRKNKYHF